jgi:hypothetical protein
MNKRYRSKWFVIFVNILLIYMGLILPSAILYGCEKQKQIEEMRVIE